MSEHARAVSPRRVPGKNPPRPNLANALSGTELIVDAVSQNNTLLNVPEGAAPCAMHQLHMEYF